MARKYWLMKTEPSVFSIDDFKSLPKETTSWEGVRNYQARNFMREMKKGDLVLIYHSNAEPTGIAGVAEVIKEAYPDHHSWDKKSKYFDEGSTKEKPRWDMVDVKFVKKFKSVIELSELKKMNELKEMLILKKGNRLSVTPVSEAEFSFISKLS